MKIEESKLRVIIFFVNKGTIEQRYSVILRRNKGSIRDHFKEP